MLFLIVKCRSKTMKHKNRNKTTSGFLAMHIKISVHTPEISISSQFNVVPWVVLKNQSPILVSYIVWFIQWQCILGNFNARQIKWERLVSSK